MFNDEQDIERELKAALTVTPSADFEWRVRQRVAEDEPSRRARLPPWLAAAAVVVLAAGAWYLAGRVPGDAPAHQVVTERAPVPDVARPPSVPAPPAPAGEPRTAAATSAAGSVRVARAAASGDTRLPPPEVLVPPAQLSAIHRLVREVNAGRLIVADAPAAAPVVQADVEVSPLVVDPIPVVLLEPGGDTRHGPKGVQ